MNAARMVYDAAARAEATLSVGDGMVEDRVATVSRLLSAYASPPLGLDITNAFTIGKCRYNILHGAAQSGDAPLVRMLLARGAWQAHHSSRSPLEFAIRGGYEEAADVLLSQDISPDAHDALCRPLHIAAICNQLGIVRRILQTPEGRRDISLGDEEDRTPLWRAIRMGHAGVALEIAQTPEAEAECAVAVRPESFVRAATYSGSRDCMYIAKVRVSHSSG